MSDDHKLDKMAQAMHNAALANLNEDMRELIITIERFPDTLDANLKDRVNNVIELIDELNEGAENFKASYLASLRLEKQHIEKEIDELKIKFLISSKETIKDILEPQIDKITKSIPKEKSRLKTFLIGVTFGALFGGLAVYISNYYYIEKLESAIIKLMK